MGRATHGFVTLPAALVLACCLSPPPAQDLLAVGFRSPAQTFRSFQTALRADLPSLEYRCFSAAFKERQQGLTELGWREFRERLFDEQPYLKYAAKAEILETRTLPDGRVRITAEVDTLFADQVFEVEFVAEEFYETRDAEGLLEDDYVPWTEVASLQGERLILVVPAPEGTALEEITEFRAGREWKIDGIHVPVEP